MDQYVRLMHSSLSGDVDAVRRQLQNVDQRAAERQLRDRHYTLEDGTLTEWPLLAQVLQLGLTDVARVLIEDANFDVNASMVAEGVRRIPLFQWAVGVVAERDEATLRLVLDRADPVLDRADLSLLLGPTDFVYELWQRRLPALVFDLLAARDLSLVTLRDSRGRTLRDRILLDSFDYGATDVVRISVLFLQQMLAGTGNSISEMSHLVSYNSRFTSTDTKRRNSTVRLSRVGRCELAITR